MPIDTMIESNGMLKSVRDVLLEKHPDAQPINPDAVSPPSSDTFSMSHPILFETINGHAIKSAALRVKGAAGPSGLDSCAWRRMCTAFKKTSDQLCNAIASVAKRICTSYVDPNDIDAYTACRLIAINKNPGVRPIGVGEVLHRIIGKAVLDAIRPDILDVTGTLQLCTGQMAGSEAAVHTINTLFSDESSDAALLINASNAFNNTQVALRNLMVICPSLATIGY